MNPEYKILKTKCTLCGKTVKSVVQNSKQTDTRNFYFTDEGLPVCKMCESKYHVLDGYGSRGYGFHFSTCPRKTAMDKESTPTFGVEIEVAGNIKNIEKIDKVANNSVNPECSIGYDTSVNGAQFELSYAPGTYYWYMYESNFKNVCKMLQKDKWAVIDDSIGIHIHIGNIDTAEIMTRLQAAERSDNMFWTILKVLGGREFNKYCMPLFTRSHHDCINRSQRWRTLEFRMFSGTYDYNTIMNRIRFLRQVLDNLQYDSIDWHKFKDSIKTWFLDLLENTTLNVTEEEKQQIRLMFSEPGHRKIEPLNRETQNWREYSERQYMEENGVEFDDEEDEEHDSDW